MPHARDLEHDLERALDSAPDTALDDAAGPADPAIIFYTSGSTARPKGVVHTHATLCSVAALQTETRRMEPGRRWLVSTGIGYELAGLAGISLPALACGATIVVEEDLSADSLIQAIARERAHATLALPTKMLDILESPLASSSTSGVSPGLRRGDECSRDLYQRFRQRFGYDLAQMLGMTECEGYLTNQPGAENRIGSVGRPAACIEVRLTRDDGGEIEDDVPVNCRCGRQA